MEKDVKKKSKDKPWYERMFCCGPMRQIPEEKKKKAMKTRRKGKILLSLLGSLQQFKLCKISRKNIAIDNYKQNDIIPLQVNRYLREKLTGTIAFTKGNISPTITDNITFVIQFVEAKQFSTKQNILRINKVPQFRENQIFIYRPKIQSTKDQRIHLDSKLIKQIQVLADQFQKTVLILPRNIIYDELGIIFSEVKGKEVEIQNIVINGFTLLVIVYIGYCEFVRIKEEEQIQFIVRELSRDSLNEMTDLENLIRELRKKMSIHQLLSILARSIQESQIDTIFMAFVRLLLQEQYSTFIQIQSIIKIKESYIKLTPALNLTAEFKNAEEEKFSDLTIKDEDLLNKGSIILTRHNEVQTYQDEQLTVYAKGGDSFNSNYFRYDTKYP